MGPEGWSTKGLATRWRLYSPIHAGPGDAEMSSRESSFPDVWGVGGLGTLPFVNKTRSTPGALGSSIATTPPELPDAINKSVCAAIKGAP